MREEDASYECPKCGFECSSDHIYGCYQFKCPKCGTIFEPEDEEMVKK